MAIDLTVARKKCGFFRRKVVLMMQGGVLIVLCSVEGPIHRVRLSKCADTDKVPDRISETWHHARMQIEGLNPNV